MKTKIMLALTLAVGVLVGTAAAQNYSPMPTNLLAVPPPSGPATNAPSAPALDAGTLLAYARMLAATPEFRSLVFSNPYVAQVAQAPAPVFQNEQVEAYKQFLLTNTDDFTFKRAASGVINHYHIPVGMILTAVSFWLAHRHRNVGMAAVAYEDAPWWKRLLAEVVGNPLKTRAQLALETPAGPPVAAAQ